MIPGAARADSGASRPTSAGEHTLVSTRPGLIFVLTYRQTWWLGPVLVLYAAHATVRRLWNPDPAPWLVSAALAWLLIGLGIRLFAWLARSYIITDQRIRVRAGLVSRVAADVPLDRIQHTTITRSPVERIFGLGTVGVTTAGGDGPIVNLLMVPRPEDLLEAIRQARVSAPGSSHLDSVPVIGLAGGIGSGKSEVGRVLKTLGCLVIDSDKEAKEALDRPEVREQLVRWWGEKVLAHDGRVSRKAVADIIFQSDKDRAALEALIHPLVRAKRTALRHAARESGAIAVVIDAPLLFEAGIDAECDFIIYVDAPRESRLARVKATRGWDEAELARRERAQIPLEVKRARSQAVVPNSGSPEALQPLVREVLDRILRGFASKTPGSR